MSNSDIPKILDRGQIDDMLDDACEQILCDEDPVYQDLIHKYNRAMAARVKAIMAKKGEPHV